MAEAVSVERDYSAPPRTEYEGRRFTAEITFYLREEATDDEVSEWLEYELGGGSISLTHPLVDSGAYLNRVAVTDLQRSRYQLYTDWGPTSKDGKRSGKGRIESDELSA